MRGTILGVVASLLSAATAWTVASTKARGVHPLWLLLAQYLIGAVLSPPRRWPVAPIRLHFLRLAAGLWAFGGYYAALVSVDAKPSEISMLLNTAPVFATFIATKSLRARLGSLVAFTGVAAMLWGVGSHAAFAPYVLALTAAGAYVVSFLVLGHLSIAGERPSTTNSLYNGTACLLVGSLLVALRPGIPTSWLPIVLIGAIAALRIQVLTIAAVNPSEAARVSVLANLAFVWLAVAEEIYRQPHSAHWGSLVLVVAGALLADRAGHN